MSHYGTTPSLPEDLNLHAGSSLKRTTASDQFLYVPLAKRQQLDPFDFGADFGWSDYSSDKDNLISGLKCLANTELEPRKNMSMETFSHSPQFDDTNVASTPAYITSLMDIVKPTDENTSFSFSETPLAEQKYWPADAAGSNGNGGHTSLGAANAKNGANVEDNVSLNMWNNNEDDDELLSELPTSIDDFQNKEYHLKLERHFSSPLVSSRQSPQCLSGRGSIASDAHPPYYSGSGKLSVASNCAFLDDEPLDEDDLEVAIINESFEEQQNQSLLYENFGLKSIFYGASMNNDLSHANSDVFGSVADNVSSPAYATDSPTAADDEDTLTYRRADRVSFVSPPTVFGESATEFTPLLTPQSKAFVRKSSNDMTDDGSIVPSPHANVVYASRSDHECLSEQDADYDKQLDLELEKMILGEDEDVQRFEAAIESGSRKSSLLKTRNCSGRLSDRSLPSLASLADISSQFSDTPDDQLNAMSPPAVVTSTRTSATEDKQSPKAQTTSCQGDGAFLDVEEKMLLSESVLRSLSEDDDYNEEVFEDPKTDDCKKPECSNSSTVVVEEKPAPTPEVHEQEVPDGIADSWEDLDDDELEKTTREAFQAKSSAKDVVVVLDSTSSSPSTWDNSVLPFVLEAHGFPASTTVEEIAETLSLCGFSDVWAKKIDDRHAFVVFPSSEKAANALFQKAQIKMKLRPLSDSPSATQSQALKWKTVLKPKTARPATNASVARRLIANSLGVSVQVSREKRQQEQQQLKLAKEQKKQKEAIWAD